MSKDSLPCALEWLQEHIDMYAAEPPDSPFSEDYAHALALRSLLKGLAADALCYAKGMRRRSHSKTPAYATWRNRVVLYQEVLRALT